MKPLYIHARNLRTWRELDLELPAGIAAIVGPNGAGKSSLVHTIDLALFGKGRELKRLATRGGDDVTVELELVFEHDGETYRVRRSYSTKGRGKPRLDLELLENADLAPCSCEGAKCEEPYWRSLTRETIDETEAELERILGLSRRTFRASSYLAQGDGAAFTEAEPRERKAIILDALGVHVWDRLRDKAAELRSEEERELSGLVARCEMLAGQVAHRDGAHAAKRSSELEAGRLSDAVADLEAGLAERRHELEEAVEAGAEKRRRLEAVEAARRAHERGLSNARLFLRGMEEVIEAKSQAAERLAALERQEEELEKRLSADGDRIAEELAGVQAEKAKVDAGQARCPTCGQLLDDDALEEAAASVRARLRSVFERQGEALSRAQEAARRRDAAAGELSLANAEVHRRMAEKSERAIALEREITELAVAITNAQAAAEELEGPDVDKLRARLRKKEGELVARRASLGAARDTLARDSERLEAIDKAAEELDELDEKREATARRVEILKLGERAFGRDGIPALILEAAAIPQLETHANAIVSELGRDYRFELRTLRATQTGGEKEALDVVVHTAEGEALYEDFSGGERTRLDLALRIALARLLASRRGSDVRLLAIDEPAYLDEEGFLALATVLRSLAGEFDTVLVVSHVDALRDAFDSAIIVGGGADTGEPSRLEEVS